MNARVYTVMLCLGLVGCLGEPAGGLAPAAPAATTVKMDFNHRPLPEIPLPNDVATRHDPTSATGLRINASLVASTRFEGRIRELVDGLDGWGVFQPLTIPFTGPLDVRSILEGHRDPDYDLENDVVYLINVDRRSPRFGQAQLLDVGNGNFPVTIEELNLYGKNDPRGWTISLLFEEADEDDNGNGKLDPGEDTDADGVLDRPNYLPGHSPARGELAGRADALMTFYERETHTLILRPILPLDERTTYAVVVTRRLKDAKGRPVGSPYPGINHSAQTEALRALPEVLPRGLALQDVAFAFAFTTQSVEAPMMAVREGLYGHGVQAQLGQRFPARVRGLEKLRDTAPKGKNPYILQPERYLGIFRSLAGTLFEMETSSTFMDETIRIHKYVDYHVIGSFDSPQLMPRTDKEGALLPLHDQIWPEDLHRVPATARAERIRFWLTVPRKEVSPERAQGKPAPVVVLAPGYGSSWIEMLFIGTTMAKHGLATICINPPSHGMEFNEIQEAMARMLAKANGFENLFNALLLHRAVDQNGDGMKDNGADFLTAYMFHTRDMLRQGALDFMQLIRLLRTFDGKRRWKHDVDGDGAPELAGDFDGDGKVDIGGSAPITMAGGSMGGMMTMLVGSLEPAVQAIAPFASGVGLGDIGNRSLHGGVPQALGLRLMGPIYTGTLDKLSGYIALEVTVPDLNEEAVVHLASERGARVGDLMVVENLVSGERGCGVVAPDGKVRAQVASDEGDRTRIAFYAGGALAGAGCELRAGARPHLTVDQFKRNVVFQARIIAAGTPLRALADGLGLRRASPELRRMLSFGALVVDAADPAAFVRHLQLRRLTYPHTKERTGAHALFSATIGDMDVPVSAGIAAGRAAGVFDLRRPDPRYGKSVNQVLIDTHTAEAIHTYKRHKSASGAAVHLDVDNLSGGLDVWGASIPRLATPLRIGTRGKDRLGGVSALIFPYSSTTGMHMVSLPGKMTDKQRERCKAQCDKKPGKDDKDQDPCGCHKKIYFDIGTYFFNVVGRYLRRGGRELSLQTCHGSDACADSLAVPKQRDVSTLP